MKAPPHVMPAPFGAVERDLCTKAGNDASAAIVRVLLLCDTPDRRLLVALQSSMQVMALCAATMRDSYPEMSMYDLMRMSINVIERGASEAKGKPDATG